MSNPSMIATPITEALGRFLDVDVARYKLIATNLANIDTPGYHTRDLDFKAELRRAASGDSAAEGPQLSYASLSSSSPSSFSSSFSIASFEPVARPVRGLMERPDGNNVSIDRESLLLAETQMKFNLGVQLLKDQFLTISLAINSGGSTS
jgi:flagellar basal-body rod protein FlgB